MKVEGRELRIMRYINISICVFLFLCIGAFSATVYALELVRIDQPKIRLSIPPGQSQAGAINIENPTSQTQSIKVYLEDWHYLPTQDGTKEFVAANSTPLSCASWISFSPAEFSLPPFSRRKVNYTVRVPSHAKGGHYAVLFFENLLGQPERKEGTVNVSLAVRMAALFYIEPAGTIERSGLIENFNLSAQPPDILSLNIDFKNTGNVDITAGGTFNIIDSAGMVYARGEFNDVYTFPGEKAKLKATSEKSRLRPGKYDLIITLDLAKALKETEQTRGLTLVKEAQLEIGSNGQIIRVGKLK